MKYLASTVLRSVLLAALLAGLTQAAEPDPEYRWRVFPTLGDSVNLTLTRQVGFRTSSNTMSVPFSSLRGLENADLLGGLASFVLRRDAGTLICKGSFVLGVGSGPVQFEPDPHFTEELKQIGLGDAGDDQLFELAVENLRLSTVRELRSACACVKTLDDVMQLNRHGVDGRYLRQITQSSTQPLEIDEITHMKDHGVSPSLLEALRSGGYQMPPKSVTELRDHGVDGAYIRELSPQCKSDTDAHDLVALHDHGVTADFVRGLRESGANPSTAEIIRLHEHGTDAALVRSAREAGLNDSISAASNLHDHGVDPDYVHGMSHALNAKVTANDLIRLHEHGISPDFAQRMTESGFDLPDPDKLISLHEHGVPVDLLQQVARSHHAKFTVGEIIHLHESGIGSDFMREFDAAGFADAPVGDLIELHNHGVTADFARRMQAEGYGNLRVSQLIKMKDHGL